MFILHHHCQRCLTCGTPEHWSELYIAAPQGSGVSLQPFRGAVPPGTPIHRMPPMHGTVSACVECVSPESATLAQGAEAYARFEEARRRKRAEAAGLSAPAAKQQRIPTLEELA